MDAKFKNKRFIIAGGGTGGHLFPALAIGEQLKKLGANIHYVGSKYGIESQIYPKQGLDHTLLNIRGFSRDISIKSILRNLLFPFRFLISFFKSLQFLLNLKPHVVIGTGGYSSGLPLFSAVLLSIPTLIHEQNSYPGITTRKLASKVNIVCLATSESAKYLIKENYFITGNPVRNSIQKIKKSKGIKFFNLNPQKPILLILGGSQGSKPINEHFKTQFNHYINSGIQLVWQCGQNSANSLKSIQQKEIIITPFIEKIELAISMSDLIVSRAGAITLAELSLCGKPMILIPFPQAAGNHQLHNAEFYSNKGAAKIVLQNELQTGILEKNITQLFKTPNTLKKMAERSTALGTSDAVNKIIQKLKDITV